MSSTINLRINPVKKAKFQTKAKNMWLEVL